MAIPFLFAGKCNKDGSKPCRNAAYSFSVSGEYTPQKEIYNVGDTIFLNSSFPTTLTNAISNQQVDYSNSLGVEGSLAIGLLDTSTRTIEFALTNFKILNISGSSTPIPNQVNGGLNILYKEDINYNIKLGIVCLKKGIYRFGLTDLGSQGIRGKDCTNAGFNITVTNTSKNLHLFQYAIGYSIDIMSEKYIYCFRVQ